MHLTTQPLGEHRRPRRPRLGEAERLPEAAQARLGISWDSAFPSPPPVLINHFIWLQCRPHIRPPLLSTLSLAALVYPS